MSLAIESAQDFLAVVTSRNDQDENIFRLLVQFKLIDVDNPIVCSKDGNPMRLNKDPKRPVGINFRCTKCGTRKKIRENTFIQGRKIKISKVILYRWAHENSKISSAKQIGTSE